MIRFARESNHRKKPETCKEHAFFACSLAGEASEGVPFSTITAPAHTAVPDWRNELIPALQGLLAESGRHSVKPPVSNSSTYDLTESAFRTPSVTAFRPSILTRKPIFCLIIHEGAPPIVTNRLSLLTCSSTEARDGRLRAFG